MTLHNIFGVAFVLIVVGWLAWNTLALWDLRDWAQKSLTGRQHFEPPTADAVDRDLERFTFGGGNDGRAANIALEKSGYDASVILELL